MNTLYFIHTTYWWVWDPLLSAGLSSWMLESLGPRLDIIRTKYECMIYYTFKILVTLRSTSVSSPLELNFDISGCILRYYTYKIWIYYMLYVQNIGGVEFYFCQLASWVWYWHLRVHAYILSKSRCIYILYMYDMYSYTYVSMHIHMHTYLNIYVYMYICIYTYIHMYIYIQMYVYKWIYTHICVTLAPLGSYLDIAYVSMCLGHDDIHLSTSRCIYVTMIYIYLRHDVSTSRWYISIYVTMCLRHDDIYLSTSRWYVSIYVTMYLRHDDMYLYLDMNPEVLTSRCECIICIRNDADTGLQRCIRCLIFIGHFPQKSPIFSGSLAEKDLQLKASYACSPHCKWFVYDMGCGYIVFKRYQGLNILFV